MATTPVEFRAQQGLTLTLELFPYGSDTIANIGGDSATEETNREGVYQADVTEALTGWHTAHILSGSVTIAVYDVYMEDDTDVHRCFDRVDHENLSVNVVAVSGDSTAADNLEADYDGTGYNKSNSTVGTVTNNSDMRGTDSALLASSAPTNFGDLAITVTTGQVTVGTNNDKSGYSISGTLTTLDALDTAQDSQHSTTQSSISSLNDISTSDVDARLAAIGLDHLVSTSVTGTDVADDSIIASLVSSSGTADWDDYDNTSDSLQAIRDRGDSAWATGGGGSISDILNVQPLIPFSIDLANTSTFRIGLMLFNAVDDLPSTAEITPGTISIDRKAIGGTSWSAVVTDAACSESAGLIYYDEVFDSGTGYAEGDSIRITLKSQKIVVAANDYEISDSTGRIFYTSIRQTVSGGGGGGDATEAKQDTMIAELALIKADTNEMQQDWADGGRLDLILDARASQSSVDTVDSNVDAILVDTGTTLPATLTTIEGKVDTVDTVVDAILVDTDEIGPAGAGLTEAGGTGDQLSAIPWNSAWDTEVESEVTDALTAFGCSTVTMAQVNAEVLDVINVDTLVAGETLAEAVRRIGTITSGTVSGAGTGTETFVDWADSAATVVVTVDASGNRTGVTYN